MFYLSQVTNKQNPEMCTINCTLDDLLNFFFFFPMGPAVPAEPLGSLLSPRSLVPSQLGMWADVCPEGSGQCGEENVEFPGPPIS